ncbi:hypothetical protein L596_001514 [Steinernema carpocapsae]|uniref:Uncharacterized protein n=1 Tax=Steinernema carpocapsae TaxID=34508 RepID=A0A4U8ULP8_STECR|nr:hypothetical protein L596_001514 [Steinernema carpocapsae]
MGKRYYNIDQSSMALRQEGNEPNDKSIGLSNIWILGSDILLRADEVKVSQRCRTLFRLGDACRSRSEREDPKHHVADATVGTLNLCLEIGLRYTIGDGKEILQHRSVVDDSDPVYKFENMF